MKVESATVHGFRSAFRAASVICTALSEFDFRYSNRVRLGIDDAERTERAIMGIVGKRLTYRTANI